VSPDLQNDLVYTPEIAEVFIQWFKTIRSVSINIPVLTEEEWTTKLMTPASIKESYMVPKTPCLHVLLMVASVMTFVAHCTIFSVLCALLVRSGILFFQVPNIWYLWVYSSKTSNQWCVHLSLVSITHLAFILITQWITEKIPTCCVNKPILILCFSNFLFLSE